MAARKSRVPDSKRALRMPSMGPEVNKHTHNTPEAHLFAAGVRLL